MTNSVLKMKTFAPNPDKFETKWAFIDAKDQVLGRLAADIAKMLMGKNKALYTPNQVMGDKVVVTNAERIAVTGRKLKNKLYQHHTGYPGAIRTENLETLLKRNPTEVLRKAVKGMLPKNKLQKVMMANLYIYAGGEHPHHGQEPKEAK